MIRTYASNDICKLRREVLAHQKQSSIPAQGICCDVHNPRIELSILKTCIELLDHEIEYPEFWDLVSRYETEGERCITYPQKGTSSEAEKIWAYIAWCNNNPLKLPANGIAVDVSKHIVLASAALNRIVKGSDLLLSQGQDLRCRLERVNILTFREISNEIILREGPVMSHEIFWAPKGGTGQVVLLYCHKDSKIILSVARHNKWLDALELLQEGLGRDSCSGNQQFACSLKKMTERDWQQAYYLIHEEIEVLSRMI